MNNHVPYSLGTKNSPWHNMGAQKIFLSINECYCILSLKRTEFVFLVYGLKMVYKPVYQNVPGNIRIPCESETTLLAHLHSTTGFGHQQASRKSIPTSRSENENQWFKGDEVFVYPLPQCAKNCHRYWQCSNEQSRNVSPVSMELTTHLWGKHQIDTTQRETKL